MSSYFFRMTCLLTPDKTAKLLHSLATSEILYFKETIGVEERKAIISQVCRGKGQ